MCIPTPRLRRQRVLAKVAVAAFFFTPVLVRTSFAYVSTFTVPVETSDQTLVSDGSVRALTEPASRVGAGYGTQTSSIYVMPFKLPVIPVGERIVSATLAINLEGWDNRYSRLQNFDVYGIGTARVSGSANQAGNVVSGTNPAANPLAILLQDNFLAGGTDAPSISASGLNNVKQTADFGAFVQELYDNGGVAGNYGFLVLAHDAALNELRYLTFTSANTATTLPKPVLVLKTDYEANVPRDYYLDGSGTLPGNGSKVSPFNSFNLLQPLLKPGDTVYCTGTFGVIDMYTTTGTHGKNPFAAGTDTKPISYKGWAGRDRPHISELIFHGVQKQTWLSFEDFLFSPGVVDDADYVRHSAINLSGAWNITFSKCIIEGPQMNVGNLTANSFAPYVPTSRDLLQTSSAIVSGYPKGDASHVVIKNCRIRYCGIGVHVYEHSAYAGAQSRDWQILDNEISAAAEDGIRFAGSGDPGAGSIVRGNIIHNQDGCRGLFAWYGYIYRNGHPDPTAFDGKVWPKVTQVAVTGTTTRTQTGVVYWVKPETALGPGYARIFVYPDDVTKPMIRNAQTPLVMSSTDSGGDVIEFRPSKLGTVDVVTGTIIPGGATGGDSPHTDGISIMGMMTGGLFDRNRVDLSSRGGGALKMENIPLKRTNVIRTGTMFTPSGTVASGSSTAVAITINGTTTTTTVYSSGTTTTDVVDTGRVIYSGTTTTIVVTANGTTSTVTTGTTVSYENRHPTDIVFRNNLFHSTTPEAPSMVAYLCIIAGGKNCWFINNTIFGGIFYNPNGAMRFGKDTPVDSTPERNSEFKLNLYNNLISGGDATNLTPEDPKVVSKHNLWMQPPVAATVVTDSTDVVFPKGGSDRAALMIFTGFTQDGVTINPPGDLRINLISPAKNLGLTNSGAGTLLVPTGTNPIPVKDITGTDRVDEPDAGAYEVGSPLLGLPPGLPEEP